MTEEQEQAMLDAHVAEIERVYGKEAAKTANIGWGWAEGSIASKIYGPKGGVCTTTYDEETGEIEGHDHA